MMPLQGIVAEERSTMMRWRTLLDLCIKLPSCEIACIINISLDRTNVPISGPVGDYEGASRKEFHDIIQREFNNGYKKFHGIKVETMD